MQGSSIEVLHKYDKIVISNGVIWEVSVRDG